jgi:transposase
MPRGWPSTERGETGVQPFRAPRSRGIDWSMAEELGRVRERSDGRCYVDFGRAGKVYSSRGAPFRDERDARHVLEAIRALVAQGLDLRSAIDRWLPTSSAAHRIDRWLDRWLRRMRERVESGERSAGYLTELERWCARDGHLASWWAHRSVHEIDYATLDEWVAWLAAERKLSAKTRWNVVAAMSAFLGWMRKIGEIPVVPAIPWPTVREHAPRLLSADAQRQVLEAIPETSRGIFLALALLGLRLRKPLACAPRATRRVTRAG